jgi:hypothetical protein
VIPAAAVHPDLDINASGAFQSPPVGLAGGATAEEILRVGLLDALGHARLLHHLRGTPGSSLIALDEGERANGYTSMLAQQIRAHGRRELVLFELRGSGPAAVVVASAGARDEPVSGDPIGIGADIAEAIGVALLRLLASLHTGVTPAASGVSVGDLLPGFVCHPIVPRKRAPVVNAPAPRDLVIATRDSGVDVLATDITPCDLRATDTLRVGAVLLAQTGLNERSK